jgi:hypothetical protein
VSRTRLATVSLVTLALAATGAGSAATDPFLLGDEVQVTTASGLAGCPFGASEEWDAAYTNSEPEPQVAVNPTNVDEVLGVYQQDRWPDGGARGLTSSMSTDGGASWAKLADVAWSACQGGDEVYGRVTDPWVTYDGAGNAYFIGQPIDSAALGASAISVTSFDRLTGAWRDPQYLIEDVGDRFVFNDKVSITGDPTRPGHAYATWLRGDFPPGQQQSLIADLVSFAFRGQPMFSRTTDGGATWSTPVPMRESNNYFQGNQIAVGPDGTLYNVTANLFQGAGIQPNLQGVYIGVMRSRDVGRTWSAPTRIAKLTFSAELHHPDDPSDPVRAEDYLPDIAIDRTTGAIYVAWADGHGGEVMNVLLSKSSDGGRHWTAPQIAATEPEAQSFNHSVQVTRDGTLVFSYYDFRNNVPEDGIATTDVWLRHSHDGGTNWDPEQHLHGPFDMAQAPISYSPGRIKRGYFLGDYMGLEPLSGDDVINFYASSIVDGTDVWSRRAEHP